MKKKEKSHKVELPQVKLFLEDLEAIEDVFNKDCDKYKIETEDYEYNTIEELKKNERGKLDSIRIFSSKPLIEFSLQKKSAEIFCGKDDTISIGISSKIEKIIGKRVATSKLFSSQKIPQAIFLMIISISLTLFLLYKIIPDFKKISDNYFNEESYFNILNILAVALVILAFFQKYVSERKHSKIYLEYKSHHKNFLTRNKDQIILSIISALLGAIFGIIGTILVFWVT